VNNLTRTVPNVVYGVMPREQAPPVWRNTVLSTRSNVFSSRTAILHQAVVRRRGGSA
jgi:hypothetical protein